jgi:UDP-3-O-[3-hydroxymyristoyl] glucosamine N-acyltransferase
MAQPSFVNRPPSSTLAEIASLAKAHLIDAGRAGQRVAGLASLEDAGPIHLTFFDNAKYAGQLAATLAGACLVSERFEAAVPPHVAVLRAANPFRAFVSVASDLHSEVLCTQSWFGITGIAASAVIHPTARLEDGVIVEPLAVVGPGVELGADTVIGSGAVIGANVRIGRGCSVGPGGSVQFALIGNNVLLHPGCHIGQDGHGFDVWADAAVKLPHTGRVLIQHDVEIGAGATIDRGWLRDTVIGEGSKIGNLVRIAADCVVGRHGRIGAQSGIAAGAWMGDRVELGAAVQIRGHVRIAEGGRVVPARVIEDDLAADAVVSPAAGSAHGNPAGEGRG